MRLPGAQCFEVAVIGGGHAGCEAALAAARLGLRTVLVSSNLDLLAHMPCNCSIGGPGKAHLVSEIVALGGEMGRNIDRTFTHLRVLNATKGPAVQALRAQADKSLYRRAMKQTLESQPGLALWQDMAVAVEASAKRVTGILTAQGGTIPCQAVVITTGTFLNGLIHTGDLSYPAGRAGEAAAVGLTASLEGMGVSFQRFKTGTVPRILKSSAHLQELAVQPSDPRPLRFHHSPVARPSRELLPCWTTHTTPDTHALVRANLHHSALVSGRIQGIGPRYCPSLEAKLLRFPDRERHTLFLEQEGWDTDEIYVQGLSNSLPAGVQLEILHSLPGLSDAVMMRPGYAIEYDCIDARQLDPGLAFAPVAGLYLAGQVNGTSGYEEAAAQGLLAGVNAARFVQGEPPLSLSRGQGYLGVMIDDLVTKGTDEPYRMLTARAEHRLWLSQGSALRRLGPIGLELGLLSGELAPRLAAEQSHVEAEITRCQTTQVLATDVGVSGAQVRTLADLLLMEGATYGQVVAAHPPPYPLAEWEQAEVEVRLRYGAYWAQDIGNRRRGARKGRLALPADCPFQDMPLRKEARDRLTAAGPRTLEEAAALRGVTAADLVALEAWLRRPRTPDAQLDDDKGECFT